MGTAFQETGLAFLLNQRILNPQSETRDDIAIMKFLFFNWKDIANPMAGGAEVVTHEISKRLVQQGHLVTIFASSFQGATPEDVIDGIRIYRAGNTYTVYVKAREYYNKYFKGEYDVIIDEINTVPFFTPKFVKNGEQIFVLIHQLAREFWHYETRFPVSFLGQHIFENRWLRRYRNIPTITVSESTRKDLEELSFKNISVIPEGINFEPLKALPSKENDPTLIFVGRLKPTKNPLAALEAYKIVKDEIPSAKLWFVGDGPLRKLLERKADKGVTVWGYLPEEKKRELMSRAHVILVPGIREGWGWVVTEANAMGTPAVAYDVPGLRDSTRHDETGLLCASNTPEELASESLRLLQDGNLCRRLSLNALKWSRSFSWENSTTEFLKYVQQQLDEDKVASQTRVDFPRKRVILLAEVTMPPLSRANLRIVKLAEALTRVGYPVTMVTPSYTPFSRKSYWQGGFHLNQFWGYCKYMYSSIRPVVRLWHLIGTIASIIYLRVRFFNVFVIHAWNPLSGIAGAIAGRILKVPVYIDFTDFYSDIAITDSPSMVGILKYIENAVLRSAAKVFVVSGRMREELQKWGIEKDKIFIVPDGTDANMFNPSISGEAVRARYGLQKSPVIIYHGDIKEPDGVDLLYRAFVKIRERVPGTKLMIVGGGEGYFRNIVKLGKDLGIHSDIIYTEWIPHKNVPEHIAATTVGAMPMRATLNHECYLSFKLFEYWGMGKPVVVTRLQALSEIVVNGYNGLICEPEDIGGMVNAYCNLLKNPEKAKQLGANGRKLVEERFNWEKLMVLEAQTYKLNSSKEQQYVT